MQKSFLDAVASAFGGALAKAAGVKIMCNGTDGRTLNNNMSYNTMKTIQYTMTNTKAIIILTPRLVKIIGPLS